MKRIREAPKARQTRRLAIALSIAAAGAAVAASAVWDRGVSHSSPARHIAVEVPKEQAGAAASVHSDASLPDAEEALRTAAPQPSEAAPTF